MATIEHVAATASPNEIIDHLQKDGAVIVDKVLPADDVARLNSELSPFLTQNAFGRDAFTGFKTQRIGAQQALQYAAF